MTAMERDLDIAVSVSVLPLCLAVVTLLVAEAILGKLTGDAG